VILGNVSRTTCAAGRRLCLILGMASRSAWAVGLKLSPALCAAPRIASAATPPQPRGRSICDSASCGSERSVGASRGTPAESLPGGVATAKGNGRVSGTTLAAGRCGPVALGKEGVEGAGWVGAGPLGAGGNAGPGRKVPPGAGRGAGGGSPAARRAGDLGVGGEAGRSGDESSMSSAPLTSSTSGSRGEAAFETASPCERAWGGLGDPDPRDVQGPPRGVNAGRGGPSSPELAEAFASATSRLPGASGFGSLSSLTDAGCQDTPSAKRTPGRGDLDGVGTHLRLREDGPSHMDRTGSPQSLLARLECRPRGPHVIDQENAPPADPLGAPSGKGARHVRDAGLSVEGCLPWCVVQTAQRQGPERRLQPPSHTLRKKDRLIEPANGQSLCVKGHGHDDSVGPSAASWLERTPQQVAQRAGQIGPALVLQPHDRASHRPAVGEGRAPVSGVRCRGDDCARAARAEGFEQANGRVAGGTARWGKGGGCELEREGKGGGHAPPSSGRAQSCSRGAPGGHSSTVTA
jgi:hypothetical protein